MKSEDIFEALYCALSSGDYPELYKVFKQSEQADTDYDDFIKMTGIEPGSDKERMLCDIIGERIKCVTTWFSAGAKARA